MSCHKYLIQWVSWLVNALWHVLNACVHMYTCSTEKHRKRTCKNLCRNITGINVFNTQYPFFFFFLALMSVSTLSKSKLHPNSLVHPISTVAALWKENTSPVGFFGGYFCPLAWQTKRETSQTVSTPIAQLTRWRVRSQVIKG